MVETFHRDVKNELKTLDERASSVFVASHHKQVAVAELLKDPHVNGIRSPEVRHQVVSAGRDEDEADVQTRPGSHL